MMRKRAGACVVLCCLPIAAILPATSLADGHAGARVSAAGVSHRLGARVLGIGMGGTDVFHLQILLTKRGYRAGADGSFGPGTRAAVMRAQSRYGLAVDGVVGPQTLAALRNGGPIGCSSTPGVGDVVTRWEPVVLCVLGMLHQPRSISYAYGVLTIIRYESSGNPAAINRWDINASRGDPSRGLMQVIGRNFARFRSGWLPDNIYDPAANIYAGLNYGITQYGSISRIPGVKAVTAGKPYRPYKIAGQEFPRRP